MKKYLKMFLTIPFFILALVFFLLLFFSKPVSDLFCLRGGFGCYGITLILPVLAPLLAALLSLLFYHILQKVGKKIKFDENPLAIQNLETEKTKQRFKPLLPIILVLIITLGMCLYILYKGSILQLQQPAPPNTSSGIWGNIRSKSDIVGEPDTPLINYSVLVIPKEDFGQWLQDTNILSTWKIFDENNLQSPAILAKSDKTGRYAVSLAPDLYIVCFAWPGSQESTFGLEKCTEVEISDNQKVKINYSVGEGGQFIDCVSNSCTNIEVENYLPETGLYRNAKYGFEFKYPKLFSCGAITVNEDKESNETVRIDLESPPEIESEKCQHFRMQISIYPPTDNELHQSDGSVLTNIAGYPAILHPGNPPLLETTVNFRTDKNDFEVSLYSDGKEQEKIFGQILSTFKFLE